MRQHSVLAKRSGGTVGSGTVQIHHAQAAASYAGRPQASKETRRHTGQYISAAAPGKAWVSGRVCAHAAIWCSHHDAAALEYHHSVPFFCILAGSIFTVTLICATESPVSRAIAEVRVTISSPAGCGSVLPTSASSCAGGVQAVASSTALPAKPGSSFSPACVFRPRGLCSGLYRQGPGPAAAPSPSGAGGCGMLSGEMPPSAPPRRDTGSIPAGRPPQLQYRLHAGQRYNARTGAQRTSAARAASVICLCLPQPIRCQSCPCGCRAGAAGCCARQIRM